MGAHGEVFEENLQLLLNDRQKNDPQVKLLLKMLTQAAYTINSPRETPTNPEGGP